MCFALLFHAERSICLWLSSFVRLSNHKIDKFLILEPARPQIVTLPFDHVKCHHSAQLSIPLRQFAGVLFERHHGVAIPVNVVDRDMRLSQRRQTVNRIMGGQLRLELRVGQAVGAAVADAERALTALADLDFLFGQARSEERRVGKECRL